MADKNKIFKVGWANYEFKDHISYETPQLTSNVRLKEGITIYYRSSTIG